jgi:hypothetical protein
MMQLLCRAGENFGLLSLFPRRSMSRNQSAKDKIHNRRRGQPDDERAEQERSADGEKHRLSEVIARGESPEIDPLRQII